VTRKASAIAVICEGLRTELENRGIPREKIWVVPNAIPETMLEMPSKDDIMARFDALGLDSTPVIGYFGSFFRWEGVEQLIAALPAILDEIPGVRLLLAGGGRQEATLKKLIVELNLERVVIFAGRVPSSEIRLLYGIADLMVYPRLSNRLTEMVTPLKPLEAMAQQVAVVASDIGGHRELINDAKTGFLYSAGDQNALASRIVEVLRESEAAKEVAASGRRFVEKERRWASVAEKYVELYSTLMG
jgi:glycosyltransferase involved in cell wall biosynthesis